jgi:hypothetical protein
MEFHTEKPKEVKFERLTPQEFRNELRDRIEQSVNVLVGQKIDEYLRAHVEEADLQKIAQHIFDMALQGKDEVEIAESRREFVDDIAKRIL